jgi:nucleoside-diphosphate-sugar epimerase
MPPLAVPATPRRPLRCVVTGAAGFIGSHVTDALLRAGHSVVGVDCFTDYYPRAVKERNLAGARAAEGFTFVESDLRTADLVPLLAGADVVVHEAAMGGLRRSWEAFEEYESCNIRATHRLIVAALAAGVGHLVHASTSSVYGRNSEGDEEAPLRPDSPYGVTKLAAENLVLAYHRNFGLPVTVLRYFSIYGPRQRPDMGYYLFIDRVLRGEPITIFGDGKQSRGNTYVDDCVAATMAAVAHGASGEIFNVGGGEVVSALEAVALIGELVGVEPRLEYGPARAGEQRRARADTRKIEGFLGWRPQVGIREGLSRQVAWQSEGIPVRAHAVGEPG